MYVQASTAELTRLRVTGSSTDDLEMMTRYQVWWSASMSTLASSEGSTTKRNAGIARARLGSNAPKRKRYNDPPRALPPIPIESHIRGRGEIHGKYPARQTCHRTDELVVGGVVKYLQKEGGEEGPEGRCDVTPRHTTSMRPSRPVETKGRGEANERCENEGKDQNMVSPHRTWCRHRG